MGNMILSIGKISTFEKDSNTIKLQELMGSKNSNTRQQIGWGKKN